MSAVRASRWGLLATQKRRRRAKDGEHTAMLPPGDMPPIDPIAPIQLCRDASGRSSQKIRSMNICVSRST